ncbi:hypothetical protein ACW7G2_02335 [Luteimonas sp. A277]
MTPAEFIDALRRRQLRSIRPRRGGDGLPPGWQEWLDQARGRLDPNDGRKSRELIAAAVARGRLPSVETGGLWWSLTPGWLRGWEPPRRDERGLRILARTFSFLLHLVLVLALAWLMHARFVLAPDADTQRGEHVIEVQFIGSGTPEEEGGGAEPAQADAVPEPEADPVSPPPQPQEPAPPDVAESVPEPSPPIELPPVAEQPLAVTETDQPDGPFLLPPIPPVDIEAPPVRAVEIAPRSRDIELAQPRELAAPVIATVDVPPRELAQPEVRIREREVVLPPQTQALPVPDIAAPQIATPTLEQPVRSARIRDVPMPPAPEPAPAPAVAGDAVAEPTASESASTTSTEQADPGRGPAPAVQEGAWSSPRRDDDWGDSSQERAGGQEGTASLFNPDGSPRLPGDGRVGGGLPPGTITEDYERIDRMGTWLKRPPTDYEPTSLDRFWVPDENLLEEWVRRSVRTVLIPIPGTSKSIRCDIVTLALAGGCSIVDPNLQDKPASARPPPDVPFRPELHEDQEGLSDDVWN